MVLIRVISDPHIKVSGHKDAVADAKEKIMAVLDTKVSYHSNHVKMFIAKSELFNLLSF
jgi:hypothetical protein